MLLVSGLKLIHTTSATPTDPYCMSDSEASTTFVPPEPDELAHLFPGYQIVRLIACGGMGAVYEAVQISLERSVAIKILPREFTADASFQSAFEAEAKAMARLNHPNLIGVYDFGEVGGMLFIIMEYVPGLSLFQAANGQPILAEDVVPLMVAVCQGLEHAHENGIIHRDIKPANILLNHANVPKIGDFGLARPLERQIQEGEDIFGTPGYTAPEVIDTPQAIDHRADLFSIGVMLHELLTGILPEADPRSASAICHCDPRFDAVIRKATHPIPSERYHSAGEIAKDLARINTTVGPRVLQTASTARRVPKIAPTYRPPQKSNGGSIFLVILLLGGVGIAGYLFLKKANQPVIVPQEPEVFVIEKPEPVVTSPITPPPVVEEKTTNESDGEPNETPDTIGEVVYWNNATAKFSDSDGKFHFEVRSGAIHGKSDDGIFQFTPWSGDGLFTLELDSLNGSQGSAGLMVRENQKADARHIFIARNPSGTVFLQVRSSERQESLEFASFPATPTFFRIHRHGDTLAVFVSENPGDWQEVGVVRLQTLASDLMVGLAAASDGNSKPLKGTYIQAVAETLETSVPTGITPLPRTNMNELFRRARSVMLDRASPIVEKFRTATEVNHASYLRMSNQFYADFSDIKRDLEISGFIPQTIPTRLSNLEGFDEIHSKHLARQQEIESDFTNEMAELEAIYLSGINSQIQRSTSADDAGAVQVFETEKQRLEKSPFYFRALMLQGF